MCGIMAVYSPADPISAAVLDEAIPQLVHRGPDGQRTWVSGDERVGLGHSRLSIIDLATGDQPSPGAERTGITGQNGQAERTRHYNEIHFPVDGPVANP